MSAPWEAQAADKRSRILGSVPSEFQHPELEHSLTDAASIMSVPEKYLSAKELGITAMSASMLVSTIARRQFSSVEVLNAFTHRAAIAHRLLNCCLAIPYDLALARAKELDAFQSRMGRITGPLHGLPISVKDQCRLIGTETTCGFVYPIGQVDQDDAVIVKILNKAGANIFAKTSLSIGCMWVSWICYSSDFSSTLTDGRVKQSTTLSVVPPIRSIDPSLAAAALAVRVH